jgi:hypothetical protein
MVGFEIALLVFLGVVIVVGIRAIAAPLSNAYAEKMKYRYRELGSESETELRNKVAYLESELLAVKQQLLEVQQSVEFVIKQNETRPITSEDRIIKIPQNQEKDS